LREENRRLKRNWPIDLIWGIGESPLDDSPSRHCYNHNITCCKRAILSFHTYCCLTLLGSIMFNIR
jgi:hypothetical protein